MAVFAVAAALLMIAPLASGQASTPARPIVSTPTSLYFHIFDVFNAFPINTQVPQPGFFKVGGTNFPSVVEPTSGTNYDFNTIYGYSTAGPVEYDFIENGQPRFHPERGIAADVKIDANAQWQCGAVTAPACVRIYVSVRDFVGGTAIPNFMPAYTFRVEMREKNVLGDVADLASGTLVMKGQKTMHLASSHFASLNGSAGPDGHIIATPNADGVVEYAIPMSIETPLIRKSEGYHVRLDWYQNPSNQPDQDDRAAEGYMRIVSDNVYHPRLDLNIMNPVYIDFVHPQVASGILLIHTAENSPWGTYDLDLRNMTVRISQGNRELHTQVKDAKGKVLFDSGGSAPVEATLTIVISQNAHVHNLHDKSAEVTYLWRFRDEGAKDGKYQITVSVQNLAKTATATATAEFVLEGRKAYGIDQGGQTVSAKPDTTTVEESPGAGLFVVATALGAALLARRRIK
jgi:hypothetical protein